MRGKAGKGGTGQGRVVVLGREIHLNPPRLTHTHMHLRRQDGRGWDEHVGERDVDWKRSWGAGLRVFFVVVVLLAATPDRERSGHHHHRHCHHGRRRRRHRCQHLGESRLADQHTAAHRPLTQTPQITAWMWLLLLLLERRRCAICFDPFNSSILGPLPPHWTHEHTYRDGGWGVRRDGGLF